MTAYYPMDAPYSNSTFTQDMAITPTANATVSGATWTSNGKIGGAYGFDGSAGYILGGYLLPYSSFSITTWINPNVYAGRIIDWRNPANDNALVSLSPVVSAGNKVLLQIRSNARAGIINIYSPAITTSGYHHVGVTYDNTTGNVSMYIDGLYCTSTTYSGGDFSNVTTNSIGISAYDLSTAKFNGSIDDVRIYNVSLTKKEIGEIYRDGMVGKTLESENLIPPSPAKVWYSQATSIDGAATSQNVTLLEQVGKLEIILKSETGAYNGTHLNYTYMMSVYNPNSQAYNDLNLSISTTNLSSTALVNVSALSLNKYVFNASVNLYRPMLDGNITATGMLIGENLSDGNDTIFQILPIDPPSAVSSKVGSSLKIWNGSAWINYTDNNMNFRCSNPFPSYCQPTNQNNETGQAILMNVNTGIRPSLYQEIKSNETWNDGVWASLSCNTQTTPTLNLTLAYQNYSTSTIQPNANNTMFCQLYVISVPANFPRTFNVTVRNS